MRCARADVPAHRDSRKIEIRSGRHRALRSRRAVRPPPRNAPQHASACSSAATRSCMPEQRRCVRNAGRGIAGDCGIEPFQLAFDRRQAFVATESCSSVAAKRSRATSTAAIDVPYFFFKVSIASRRRSPFPVRSGRVRHRRARVRSPPQAYWHRLAGARTLGQRGKRRAEAGDDGETLHGVAERVDRATFVLEGRACARQRIGDALGATENIARSRKRSSSPSRALPFNLTNANRANSRSANARSPPSRRVSRSTRSSRRVS